MKRSIRSTLLVATLTVSAALIATTSTADPGPTADPDAMAWSRVELEAKKLFLTASTTVEFEQRGEHVRLFLDTRVGGRHSTDEIVLDARTARGISRRKVKHGGDPYAKTYTFGTDGVRQVRSTPATDAEAAKEPTDWSQRSETSWPHPGAGCGEIYEPSAILYLATAFVGEAASDEPVSVCVFSDKTFSRMVLRPQGLRQVEVDHDVRDGDTTRHREGAARALELTVDVEALDGSAGGHVEVLGLEDDVHLFVDAETGVPLLLTGKMKHLGSVEVELRAVTLR